MDGTFGGGDLISASLAIMLGGGTDAELHDKEVTLTTSQITGSQTAIFEYDPQNEPVSGDPPGPWDGYSLFTIDLSGVKDDIEDLQQQISNLEDELEDCHDCWEEVVAALQQYDPTYDPDEGECPANKVTEVVEHAEECDDCKDQVVAAIQQYIPTFDPQSCEEIPPAIDAVHDDGLPPIDPTTGQPKYPEGRVPNKTDFDDWINLNQTPMKDPTRVASNLFEVEFYQKIITVSGNTFNALQTKIKWAGETIYDGYPDNTGVTNMIYLESASDNWRVTYFDISCVNVSEELAFNFATVYNGAFRVSGHGRQTQWSTYTATTNHFTSEYTAQEINNAIQNSQWTIQ